MMRYLVFAFIIGLCMFRSVSWANEVRHLTVPKDHYLGISPPCESVALARQKAIREVTVQILRTIGAQYSVRFDSNVTAVNDKVERKISEKFHYESKGFIAQIERRIVSASYYRTDEGIVFEMLVHFPPKLVERTRKLSLGAKVHARWLNGGIVELREINGIQVVLTEYSVRVREQNSHAEFFNYYVMKVSAGNSQEFKRSLPEPVRLKGSEVRRVRIMVPKARHVLRDVMLGTRRSVMVSIHGTDEVGRAVHIQVPVQAQ
jgi:hypothetical protein